MRGFHEIGKFKANTTKIMSDILSFDVKDSLFSAGDEDIKVVIREDGAVLIGALTPRGVTRLSCISSLFPNSEKKTLLRGGVFLILVSDLPNAA